MIGQTVSHYRILEKIGEGGMGVVYMAEDTHLGRHVAIKFLSAADDHNYRARFLREARAVSSLLHPHIAIIHDYGETTEGLPFIVMEYIKGGTLSELLNQSGLTLSRALEIIEAVAEALGAAHAHGIVHRDIKPSNVMVNELGQAKVLDFGLVKQLHDEHASPASLDAATLPAMRTSSNVVVGTPLYLSPEQAMGAAVDARSDLFALGALLYESLTGKPAFSGGSIIEIGAQIIHVNPPPPSAINPRVPPELDRITLKALAKKPEDRYQSAADMLAELRPARAALTSDDVYLPKRLRVSQGSHSSALKSISETLRRPRVSIGFLAVGLLIVTAAFLLLYRWAITRPTVPFQNRPVVKITNTGKSVAAAVSPDGKYVAHVLDDAGQQSLVLTYLATASNQVITSAADVQYRGITYSRDGNYIYYVRYERNDLGLLYQVPTHGGASKKIMSAVDSPISFSPEGNRFAFVRRDKKQGEFTLMVADADGSGERKLASRRNDDVFSLLGPAWSPDGRVIACADGSFAGGFHMSVVSVSVADGTEQRASSQKWFGVLKLVWLKDGSGLILAAADEPVSPIRLWYLSYPGGDAHRITEDANDYRDPSLTADSNSLVSVQSNRLINIWVAPNGDAGRATQITSGVGWTYGLAWTPNDRIIYSTTAGGNLDLWSIRSDGTDKTQLTVDAGSNYHPAVSHDGRYVFFSSSRAGAFSIWRMDIDGSNPKRLTNGDSDFYPSPSPDGQWVVYQSGGAKPTLWRVPVGGGQSLQLSAANTSAPTVSPDGKLIACRYWEESSRSQKIAIMPFEGGQPIKTFDIPIHRWQRILWTSEGRALMYVDVRAGVSNIWKQPLDGGPATQLTDFRADHVFSYDWSRDNRLLACERGVEINDVVVISTQR